MPFPIYKSRDAHNVRVYAREVSPGVLEFTTQHGREVVDVTEASGEEAVRLRDHYTVLDSISLFRHFGAGPEAVAR